MTDNPDEGSIYERKLARLIAARCRGKVTGLEDVKVDQPLAGSEQKEIAARWGKGPMPANVLPDFIFVFKDFGKAEPFLVAVEIKLFPTISRAKSRFVRGWGQLLTYGLYGFDGLAMWHLLKKEPPQERIEELDSWAREISEKWNLRAWYYAGTVDAQRGTVKAVWEEDFPALVARMRAAMTQPAFQSPLRWNPEVAKRRAVLKAVLRIPS